MSLFNQLKSFLQRSETEKESTKIDVPDGICPNCWGREEYGGHFYESVKNEGVDINNISSKKGWIEAYAIERLGGIQFKKNAEGALACPTCRVTYKPA